MKLVTQIFGASFFIAIFSLIIVSWYAYDVGRDLYLQKTEEGLENHAHLIRNLISSPLSTSSISYIQEKIKQSKKDISIRVTIIQDDGEVLVDSDKDPSIMDNHGSRPEVMEALKSGKGRSVRYSNTVKHEMMYFVLYVKDINENGIFIRTSEPVDSIEESLNAMYNQIFFIGLIVAFIALITGFLISGRITKPIEKIVNGVKRFKEGDFTKKLENPSSQDMSLLTDSLNSMAFEANDKIQTIIRQRNEQEAVFKSMAEGVIAVDYEANIITLNNAAIDLFSVSVEGIKGKYIRDVIRNTQIENFFLKVLRTGKNIEDEVVLHTEIEQRLKISTRVLEDDSANIIGAVMVLNDLTRLRQLEAGRREFVANVSHELRTPLTSIRGFAEALFDGALNDKKNAKKFIDIIYNESNRLGHILEDILTLSRLDMEDSSSEIILEKMLVVPIIKSAIKVCQYKADKKNVLINIEGAEEIELNLNKSLIEEAFINLIDNAIKYSPENKTINITCRINKKKFSIDVSDQGQGIEKEHLPRLFERFYRVDKARSRKQGGTGLGLAIVKHIALIHKGSIEVDSLPGVGSTFTLSLPV